MNRKAEKIVKMCGGAGSVLLDRLIGEDVGGRECRMFARVVLKPLCGIGYHEHHGEREIYVIESGKGIYDDNGTKQEVHPGDVLVCRSGSGHALENRDLVNLEFYALILRDFDSLTEENR